MFHTDLTPFGVDMERLAEDRLARLQAAMKRENLGALLLTDFLNIRYATNTVMMLGLRATGIQRFALIPAEGEPIICQRELARKKHYRSLRFDAYMFAMRPPVATDDFVNQTVMGLKQLGAGGELISIYDSSLADSRPHNEPMGADLVVRDGDLVICDATVAGPGGYYSDFARTFSHGTPTSETMQRYKEAYHSLQEALKFVRPGPCTEAFR